MRYIWTICMVFLALTQAQGQNATIGIKLQQWLASEPSSNRTENIILTFDEQIPAGQLLYAFERNFTPLDQRARTIITSSINSGYLFAAVRSYPTTSWSQFRADFVLLDCKCRRNQGQYSCNYSLATASWTDGARISKCLPVYARKAYR